jgi:DNA invertase Pin-like site-specific DNA recombinase
MNVPREVFGYVRVSGKSQLDGDGFDRQEDAIHAFAASKGWIVKRIFRERGVSGTVESTDREAFAEMLGLCGGVLPTTIVVERADRLARDLVVGELLFRECESAGVEVYSADSGEELVHASSDPTRVLIRQLMGALAQWEKSALVKKMRLARERIRARGERCEGAKPFSMRDPERFSSVIAWIVSARERGDSFHQIAKQLNLGGQKGPHGGRWGPSYVYKLYNNHLKANS